MYVGTFEPVSNRATWLQDFQITDENNEAIPIGTATAITLQVRDQKTKSPIMSGSLADGKITLPGDVGVFSVRFEASEMAVLDAMTYDVGLTITLSGDTSQLFIAKLPVLDGVVS